ncbi:2-pyrone-4,6-dicarbaxylate hydrolase [Roseivivax jejudonensis]|uniref:2-pyrone-4,6-dicarbaxylate hydrolase n=1 Tax=Roseivivax jejudonensis TaxID=1529041 RepID=A0A1X7A5C3_9RHOB|nr:amidohydrolase family protein [Roseivivax jejudonensis]SLN70968.1 2-pyrone-4,6-dicarbaxylate hydrolase [Roseivivax jejudonensis]
MKPEDVPRSDPGRDAQTWHPDPSRPSWRVPVGAVDAHCHVFGPQRRFPFSPTRKYTPQDAGVEALNALHRHMGIERRVIVQASCHGTDNAAMLDALRGQPNASRGVAVVDPGITDAEIDSMHEAGVRGVRFNFLKRLVDPGPLAPRAELAARVAERGWHVVVYFEAADLPELTSFLEGLPCPVVVDHMGRPDTSQGVDSLGFTAFRALMENERFWVKVGCPERLSRNGPPYDDVTPFAATLVADTPDRVLWGTDWPHPNMASHLPDDGLLLDQVPIIAPSTEARQKLMVDNPLRLYWS